jgi:dTDP-4-dehydrorhamnose 3,5-epimerase
MKINNYSKQLQEVKICTGVYFEDHRGILKKSMHGDELNEVIPNVKEVLCTTSKKNVIRGLHYQEHPFEIKKLITCVKGSILDVFVDVRKNSKTYGMFGTKLLSEEDANSVLIPEGYAHGYSTISEESIVVYIQSGNYNPEYDRAINPLSMDIDWKVQNPIVSEKDLEAINFQKH